MILTVAELLALEMPPRFWPDGTPYPHPERGCCNWCGGPLPGRRQSWCSDECVQEWCVRSSGSWVRDYVFKRDQGVCAKCGRQHGWPDGPWDADHIGPYRPRNWCCWRPGDLPLRRPLEDPLRPAAAAASWYAAAGAPS